MLASKWLRWARLGLPAVGLVILVVMLARLDCDAMIAQMDHISGGHLALAALLFAGNACVKCVRWLRLLRTHDIILPYRDGALAYFASIFYGLVTIGGVGELSRIGVLIARDVQWSKALVSCLFDRVLDVSLLSLIALIALIHIYLPPPGRYFAFAVLAGLVISALLGGQRILQWCASSVQLLPIIRNMPNHAERIRSLFEATIPCAKPARLCELVVWTIIGWVGYMGTMLVLADGLAIQVSACSVVAASALGGLTVLLPISFQGVGTREPMFVLVLGREGVSHEQAVLLAMLGFWIVYFTAIVIGLIGLAGQAAGRRALAIPHPSGDHEMP